MLESPMSIQDRARDLFEDGRIDEGASAFRAAMRERAARGTLWSIDGSELALRLRHAGRLAEAAVELRLVLADEELPHAEAEAVLGRHAEAVTHVEEAVRLNPETAMEGKCPNG